MLHSEAQDLHLVWDSCNKMIAYIMDGSPGDVSEEPVM